MKQKGLIILSVGFFLIVNTTYYWEGKLGLLAFPAFLILVLVYLGLTIAFIRQLYFLIKEKFKNKYRILTASILIVILILTITKPYGIIDFDKLQGDNVLVAQREGAANCMTTLKLKDDYTFRESSICFGVSEIKGKYHIENDTIFFDNVRLSRNESEYYKFAIIQPSKYDKDGTKFDLIRFKNQSDTIGHELWIIKNDLDKIKN